MGDNYKIKYQKWQTIVLNIKKYVLYTILGSDLTYV